MIVREEKHATYISEKKRKQLYERESEQVITLYIICFLSGRQNEKKKGREDKTRKKEIKKK